VARRATELNEQRKLESDLLLLSAGDFSGAPGIIEMYRSRFLAQTMVAMRYDAVAVGERDFNFGLRMLEAEAADGLPLICANLYRGTDRLFPPAVIKRIRGETIGIFALLGEEPREMGDLELREAADEARAVLVELRKKCDYVILLAHMERGELLDLLPRIDGVDLVIRGHSIPSEKVRESCEDTLSSVREGRGLPVLSAGELGRNLGRAVIAPDERGKPIIIETALLPLNRSVADDSMVVESLKAFQEEEAVRRKELQIGRNLSRDEITGRLLDRYLGIEVCRRCHGDLMPRFIASRHFRAFETLRRNGADEQTECLSCHTTGYGRPGGFDPEKEKEGAPYLLGIQCEACHGPGTAHARGGSYAQAARESCRTCHTSEWSPDFDFETYWKRLPHCGGSG